jgi:uncharacterized oligopeptide transporter (OPT) family protein
MRCFAFVFIVGYVAQLDLKLVGSSDPPISGFQIVGAIGTYHHFQLKVVLLCFLLCGTGD